MNVVKEIQTTKTRRVHPGAKTGAKRPDTAATKTGKDHRYLTEADTINDKGLSVYPEAIPDEDAVGFIGLGDNSIYPHVV